MAKKNVTFADIAAYTGFSKTTISRYFNNPDSITVENQEKIANALEVLDYKENKLARVMANGKTEMVGVIIPNLYMHYYSDMLDHIISTYEEYGYSCCRKYNQYYQKYHKNLKLITRFLLCLLFIYYFFVLIIKIFMFHLGVS